MNYFYGPVPSRRLGFSLGVDLTSPKVCSFECIYCQLGATPHKTTRRFSAIDLGKLKKELRTILKRHPHIDYITISGSGEPTLHKNLDKIISVIKKVGRNKYPVCVITNSSLLYRKDVRRELKKADLIIPSLDAATPATFKRINRPHKSINLNKIVKGLIALRKEFKGKIWLEIMLLKGVNDSLKEAKKFKELVREIKPDKIQLNLPIRPTAQKVSFPDKKRIGEIKKILGKNVEVATVLSKKTRKKFYPGAKHDIVKFLKRRPATIKDLAQSLRLHYNEVLKCIDMLIADKKVREYRHEGRKYFIAND